MSEADSHWQKYFVKMKQPFWKSKVCLSKTITILFDTGNFLTVICHKIMAFKFVLEFVLLADILALLRLIAKKSKYTKTYIKLPAKKNNKTSSTQK